MPLLKGGGGTATKPRPQARVTRPAPVITRGRPVKGFTTISGNAVRPGPVTMIRPTIRQMLFVRGSAVQQQHEAHRAHLIFLNRQAQARAGHIAGPAGFTGGGNTRAPASRSEADWIKTLLHVLGAPETPANVNSLAAWIRHESTWTDQWGGALWTNNPLNTTQPASGATNWFNGIKKYPTAAIGIAATAATIVNYPQILSALRSGNGICGGNLASNFSTWSGGGYSRVCLCLTYSVT